jgi:DNA-binding beta-propeller fold protein YncE
MNIFGIGVLAVGLAASVAARAESVIVLNSEDTSYSVIDRATRTEIGRYALGREPHHIAVTPDGKEVLLASTVTNDLVSLDTKTGEPRRIIRDIVDAYQLGFSPDGKWFVTAANRLDHIDIYRAADFKLVSRVFVDSVPSHLAFDTESKTVFVSLQETSRVVAYDLEAQAIKWNVEVGKTPAGLLMLPDNKRLLVALTGADGVQTLDPKDGKITGFLQTGKGAHQFWPRGDGRHWFVSNRVDSTVSLVDMQEMKVVGTVVVPGGPDCMDITADGKEMWITQRFLRRVAVVDLAQMKVVASVRVGKSPHGVYILKGDATPAATPPLVRAAATEPPTQR